MMHLEQIHHVFASAISFECGGERKRQELCAALSRDACRQMLVYIKTSMREVTMSAAELWGSANCMQKTLCLRRAGIGFMLGLVFF